VAGAIKDSGTATESYVIAPDLSVVGTKLLEGRRGTLTIEFTAQLAPDLKSGTAQWWIIDGTGAYKKIRGSGAGTVGMGQAYEALYAEYSGAITKDPSLK
jgi:hypothetical protein